MSLSKVAKEMQEFVMKTLKLETLTDFVFWVKEDNWASELESKVVAPAVAAKCNEADTADLALARVRAAWYAGNKALRSSAPRQLTEDEEAPMSSQTRAMLDRQ